jgi:hypothetical protein
LVTESNAIISGFTAVVGNVTAGNISSAGLVFAGAPGVSATGNIRGGNVVSDDNISATGNVFASNFFSTEDVSATGNVIANNASIINNLEIANLIVIGTSTGTGVGVENIVRQNSAVVIEPAAVSNVGDLGFTALANQAYKFSAVLPVTPEGSTTTTFSVLFDSGSCNYVVEAQETATSIFSVASSNSSNSGISRTMTGTNLRFVRITGTFFHTGNVDVAIRSSTSAANLTVATGAHLNYTRTA